MNQTARHSTLRCPACGHSEIGLMPDDACQWFYECKHCHQLLSPKLGDCCVFCCLRQSTLSAGATRGGALGLLRFEKAIRRAGLARIQSPAAIRQIQRDR